MTTGFQNPFSQQPSPLTPGREIRKVWKHTFPSGQTIELRWITTTIQDAQGIWRTKEIIEVVPPPRDGSVVTKENYPMLQECTRCLGVTVQPYQCKKCRQWVCMVCTDEAPVQGKQDRVCKDCAWEINYPCLSRLRKLIWGK